MTTNHTPAPAHLRPRKTGLATVADVRARCIVDPVTGCWNWQGGTSLHGDPRLWAFCHRKGDKRCMTGPLAMWNIAHGASPTPGYLVFRRCVNMLCLNPVHLGTAKTKADIGLHIQRAGTRKGTCLEQRRANLAKAQAVTGHTATAPEKVARIRSADKSETCLALAAELGISKSAVSRIRRGDRIAGASA